MAVKRGLNAAKGLGALIPKGSHARKPENPADDDKNAEKTETDKTIKDAPEKETAKEPEKKTKKKPTKEPAKTAAQRVRKASEKDTPAEKSSARTKRRRKRRIRIREHRFISGFLPSFRIKTSRDAPSTARRFRSLQNPLRSMGFCSRFLCRKREEIMRSLPVSAAGAPQSWQD